MEVYELVKHQVFLLPTDKAEEAECDHPTSERISSRQDSYSTNSSPKGGVKACRMRMKDIEHAATAIEESLQALDAFSDRRHGKAQTSRDGEFKGSIVCLKYGGSQRAACREAIGQYAPDRER